MSLFSATELKRLLENNETPCVSLYLPTHIKGAETQQDPIRLKNLLGQAESMLASMGLDQEQIESQLAPAWELTTNRDFWQHQDQGLALFMTQNHSFIYRAPLKFQAQAFVSQQFHVKPMLPLLVNDGQYYILVISQNKARFFQATRDTIQSIDLESMPRSLAEALRYDDPEKQLQYHSPSSGVPIYHGQGGANADQNTDLLRYFQAIDQEVMSYLSESNAPMIFVGVDYLFPICKQATSYAYWVEESVTTNPDQMSADEIHQQTWPVIEPIFKQTLHDAIASHQNQVKTDYTTSSLLDILVAAHDGQIETLFIPQGRHIWGHFDAKKRRIELEIDSTPENTDLLNLAAIYTLFCQGQVYAIAPEHIPGGEDFAATLRFPLPALQAY